MKRKLLFFRYFAYSLEIILLYVLQSTPNLMPEIFGSKPVLLVAVALSIASREDKIPSLIFGAVCGIFADTATGGGVGFFAIALTLVCYFEAYLYSVYFVPTILTVMIISVVVIPLLISVYFLLFRVFAGVPDSGTLFVNHYISRIIYTLITVVPLYFLNGFLYKSLNNN